MTLAVRNNSNAAAAEPVQLSAARLSALRHDLRTPFNQIVGYAEMVGEDVQQEAAATAAQSLVLTAHALLAQVADGLSGEPSHITPVLLERFREQVAEPFATLSQQARELRRAAEAEPGFCGEIGDNLNQLDRALANLRTLLDATSAWHESPANGVEEPIVVPALESLAEPIPAYAPGTGSKGSILIVDDQPANLDVLRQRLDREGFQISVAGDGPSALRMLEQRPFDLVLLDVMMPGMDGLEVLRRIKATHELKSIPVIMISAVDEIERVVQCIENGAEDYLSKPFNPVLLRARIGVAMERKRLYDEEAKQRSELSAVVLELAQQREQVHRLLLNILPERVAADLQQGHSAPMYFEDTTICFTDFVGFTLSTEKMAAEDVVEHLHTYFTAFDRVMERYGLEKLKTIGDSYMFASGLPKRHPANPVNAVLGALELLDETRKLSERPGGPGWMIRIGLHTGPLIAGVVGIRKFAFDIWGDSVNFASRMESSGAPGCINISERTYTRVKDFFLCEHRGKVMTKDHREVDMYFVRSIHPNLTAAGDFTAFNRRYRLYFSEEPPPLSPSIAGVKA